MTATSALQPVAEALYALLQDATLLAALSTTAVQTDVPDDPVLPFVWIEIPDEQDRRGLGTGLLSELEVRTHTFSAAESWAEAQTINGLVVGLLKDTQALTVTGYALCGYPIWQGSRSFPDQILNGVKVHEIVSTFLVRVEPTS